MLKKITVNEKISDELLNIQSFEVRYDLSKCFWRSTISRFKTTSHDKKKNYCLQLRYSLITGNNTLLSLITDNNTSKLQLKKEKNKKKEKLQIIDGSM